MLYKIQAPSTRIPFCLKTEIFFHPLWRTAHTYLMKTASENASFQRPQWRFLKTPASRLRADGRKRRYSNTMMSYTIYYQHYACSVRDAIVSPSSQRLMWTGEKYSHTLRADGEKHLRFQKNPGTCRRNLRGGQTRCIMPDKDNRFHKLVVQFQFITYLALVVYLETHSV